jgi:hypothetical protein
LPVPVLGIDSDNDSAFINETLQGYCKDQKIEFTRSRPYQKNEQAWIEQKNGSVSMAKVLPPSGSRMSGTA